MDKLIQHNRCIYGSVQGRLDFKRQPSENEGFSLTLKSVTNE